MPVERASADRSDELIKNYERINERVTRAASKRPRTAAPNPRLVAVSKLKPSSDILALHEHGVRHFGENYPQELEAKAKELPEDIQWHYIGTLQSNKCKMLAAIPNLYAIETLTSIKAANHLNSTLSALSPRRSSRLNVFLQVNTSGESSKSGLAPLSTESSASSSSELVEVAKHILLECRDTIQLKGLMTIGSWDHSTTESEVNPDFETLRVTRAALVKRLREEGVAGELEEEGLELSMGMSNDFEKAIEMGSTNVRVGSDIFGAREPRR